MTMPIIPWIGGKRRLAERLLPYFPAHKCYVEPFAGGAALFFMRPTPAEVEVINDINGELINLYRVVTHHLQEFARQFTLTLSSREVFKCLQDTPPQTMTDIQRAARFYYLQQSAFGGKVQTQTWGTATTSSPGLNLTHLEQTLSAAHLRLSNAYIENLPWEECVRRYDREHTLFFIDPPYWETNGYGVDFGWEQYQALAAMLSEIKGKAIVTLNDHPDIRALFNDFVIESTDIRYIVGGSSGVKRQELIVFSWDVHAEPSMLL